MEIHYFAQTHCFLSLLLQIHNLGFVVFSLIGNPVCTSLSNNKYCQLQQISSKPYSTSLTRCGSKTCPVDRKLSPQSCECAVPYEGILYFRAPSFRELSNATLFQGLETSMSTKLDLTPGSVSLQNLFFNPNDYLQIQLALFPASGEVYFNRSEIQRIGFELSNQTYKPPKEFGPYYFIASPYTFPGNQHTTCLFHSWNFPFSQSLTMQETHYR